MDQLDALTIGIFSAGKKVFAGDAEEKSAWTKYRDVLMREHSRPGSRPYGFFRWDLGMAQIPARWWERLDVLWGRGLLNAEEQILVENTHQELGAKANPGVTKDALVVQNYSRTILAGMLSLHQFCARWHRARGRMKLAARYQRCADAIRAAALPAS